MADPGDGTKDVFIVNQAATSCGGREIRGSRELSPPVTINPGCPVPHIAFVPTQRGDLLASVDLRDNAVSLYAYRGGQFVRVGSLATGTLPTQIVAGDLTGDGKRDLVVLDAGDGAAAVYLGNGIGGFAGVTTYPSASAPRTSPWPTSTGRGTSTSSSPARSPASSPFSPAPATAPSAPRLRIPPGLARTRSMSAAGGMTDQRHVGRGDGRSRHRHVHAERRAQPRDHRPRHELVRGPRRAGRRRDCQPRTIPHQPPRHGRPGRGLHR